MCETIAMVVRSGELPRAEAARFLRAFYSDMAPQDPHEACFVWQGWQSAIAMLGLVELRPLVEGAFARKVIHPGWLRLGDFEKDLQLAIDDPAAPPHGAIDEYTLFGDTVAELSRWSAFLPKEEKYKEKELWRDRPVQSSLGNTAVNPHRNVGRNDPCPCGSGKKFKKCCLQNAQSAA
jgi:hypothetical protein